MNSNTITKLKLVGKGIEILSVWLAATVIAWAWLLLGLFEKSCPPILCGLATKHTNLFLLVSYLIVAGIMTAVVLIMAAPENDSGVST